MEVVSYHRRQMSRRLFGSVLALPVIWAVLTFTARSASPHVPTTEGIALRGPAAQIRARLDRVAGLGPTTDGVRATDLLLGELRSARDAVDGPLDVETIEHVAREAISLRSAAVLEIVPVRRGFREAFVRTVADGATFADWATGIPASITIAQAILESDWGRAAPGNNLFGLKGEGPAGSNLRRVVEYRNGHRGKKLASFRAYRSVAESLLDHGRILANSKKYAKARAVSEDPAAFARALQGVYATDPRYATKLVHLVEGLELGRFDWVDVSGRLYSAVPYSIAPHDSSIRTVP